METSSKDWLNPKIEIRETPRKGRGMFAVSPIEEGEVVLIWGGRYVNKEEAEHAQADGKLVMQWDDDLFSVEDRGDDRGYFVNHSCDPNTWMGGTLSLLARRRIEPGEEVTMDYAQSEGNENYVSKWNCECGTNVCRRKVTGKDWRIPEIAIRYRGHFSPLIEKRIAATKFGNK